jgi:hypothetical protein
VSISPFRAFPKLRCYAGLIRTVHFLAATCGLSMTTTRNSLPHAIPKGECDQQENYNSKSVHCEIPRMRKCRPPAEAAPLGGLGGDETASLLKTTPSDRHPLYMH